MPLGGVHGFLGPNGAGKTTAIRVLLGLVRGDSGELRILDHEVPRQLPEVVHRIGAVVEQPRFFPAFSATKNLELQAQGMGLPQSRVAHVLDEVGLTERSTDPFHTYSLGMKQRLALAGALVADPELLIFDEPTNGLDPAGIRDIRATMRDLADRGKTVLVSSHMLSEVQQIADTVSIIGRGRLLAEGRVRDILTSGGGAVHIGVNDSIVARQVLTDSGLVVTVGPGHLLTVASPKDPHLIETAAIIEVLTKHGLQLQEFTPVQADLESVFLALTSDDHLGSDRSAEPQRSKS